MGLGAGERQQGTDSDTGLEKGSSQYEQTLGPRPQAPHRICMENPAEATQGPGEEVTLMVPE